MGRANQHLKPAEGMTFASIFKDIHMKVKPEENCAVIYSVRQTCNEGVLVELDKETRDKALFTTVLEGAVGAAGTVETLELRVTLEIRDVDAYSDQAEVTEATRREDLALTKMKVSWINCTVRVRTDVRRCFKCLGFGH